MVAPNHNYNPFCPTYGRKPEGATNGAEWPILVLVVIVPLRGESNTSEPPKPLPGPIVPTWCPVCGFGWRETEG